jgi:polysaccharide biosynthesis protein PslH
MRYVFFKHQLNWPRQAGHDIRSAEMMRAIAAKGHDVVFLSRVAPDVLAIDGLGLAAVEAVVPDARDREFKPPGLQARFFRYWGVAPAYANAIARACARFDADVLVSMGLDALPYLVGPHRAVRVWYAADEWVLHHLSQVRLRDRTTWRNLEQAFVKGIYQRAFAGSVDRMWVVTERDAWAGRWIAGFPNVDVIANGVDTHYYGARPVREQANSAVFWGRLDFGPNVQALQWFLGQVWPAVRARCPTATLRIIGFKPSPEVRQLSRAEGVTLQGDLADLRDEVCRHMVAIAPMVSGLGIKNKLLEAAAMARPIVCTSRATLGMRLPAVPPMVIADRAANWVSALLSLWSDDAKRRSLGGEARSWVETHHSWSTAADLAMRPFESPPRAAQPAER